MGQGDGLKIVSATGGGFGVAVFVNDGSGAFAATVSHPVNEGFGVFSIATGDLDGDGSGDILAGWHGRDDSPGSVSVLLNSPGDGGGSFPHETFWDVGAPPLDPYPLPGQLAKGTGPDAIALADMNGDGKLDLVTANTGLDLGHHAVGRYGDVSVVLNAGNGTFSKPSTHPAGLHPNAIAAGDLDGDGKPDVVVTNGGSGSISVLLNISN